MSVETIRTGMRVSLSTCVLFAPLAGTAFGQTAAGQPMASRIGSTWMGLTARDST